MGKKRFFRAALFWAILLAVIFMIFQAGFALGMPKSGTVVMMNRRFKELYSGAEGDWDGVVIGTSIADRSWAAPAAWEKYGMAVYPMSTDKQPFVLSRNVIEEIRKYQDISFVVVELHGLREDALEITENGIRWVTDNMKKSENRTEAINRALGYADAYFPESLDGDWLSRLAYYIPFIRYHVRLTAEPFYRDEEVVGESRMMGTYEDEPHGRVEPVELTSSGEAGEIGALQKLLLDEFLEYASREQLPLLFYVAPDALSEESNKGVNGIAAYLEELGYPVLNYNDRETLEGLGMDGTRDFIDTKHLNTGGARKVTEALADFIKKELNPPDHRGEAEYRRWDEAAEYYEEFFRESLEEIEENYQEAISS